MDDLKATEDLIRCKTRAERAEANIKGCREERDEWEAKFYQLQNQRTATDAKGKAVAEENSRLKQGIAHWEVAARTHGCRSAKESLIFVNSMKEELATTKDENGELRSRIAVLQAQQQALVNVEQSRRQNPRNNLVVIVSEAQNNATALAAIARTAFDAQQSAISRLGVINNNRNHIASLQTRLTTATNNLATTTTNLTTTTNNLATTTTNLNTALANHNNAQNALNAEITQHGITRNQSQTEQQTSGRLRNQVSTANNAAATGTRATAQVQAQLNTENADLRTANADLQTARNDLNTANTNLQAANRRHRTRDTADRITTGQMANLTRDLATARTSEANLRGQVRLLMSAVAFLLTAVRREQRLKAYTVCVHVVTTATRKRLISILRTRLSKTQNDLANATQQLGVTQASLARSQSAHGSSVVQVRLLRQRLGPMNRQAAALRAMKLDRDVQLALKKHYQLQFRVAAGYYCMERLVSENWEHAHTRAQSQAAGDMARRIQAETDYNKAQRQMRRLGGVHRAFVELCKVKFVRLANRLIRYEKEDVQEKEQPDLDMTSLQPYLERYPLYVKLRHLQTRGGEIPDLVVLVTSFASNEHYYDSPGIEKKLHRTVMDPLKWLSISPSSLRSGGLRWMAVTVSVHTMCLAHQSGAVLDKSLTPRVHALFLLLVSMAQQSSGHSFAVLLHDLMMLTRLFGLPEADWVYCLDLAMNNRPYDQLGLLGKISAALLITSTCSASEIDQRLPNGVPDLVYNSNNLGQLLENMATTNEDFTSYDTDKAMWYFVKDADLPVPLLMRNDNDSPNNGSRPANDGADNAADGQRDSGDTDTPTNTAGRDGPGGVDSGDAMDVDNPEIEAGAADKQADKQAHKPPSGDFSNESTPEPRHIDLYTPVRIDKKDSTITWMIGNPNVTMTYSGDINLVWGKTTLHLRDDFEDENFNTISGLYAHLVDLQAPLEADSSRQMEMDTSRPADSTTESDDRRATTTTQEDPLQRQLDEMRALLGE
ncbi:hypothetical protein BDZ85DRAFT_253638 [Elsinoe ampelina]|uniref:Uncharacterized protein n=1 Tax=Elsinoe ampelina TaxID=302913 RepID=A0A6A6FY82_9PEZI|nr:hypothetical protein BDZ85DRAFT_253638 [Elsinoe ampelina]